MHSLELVDDGRGRRARLLGVRERLVGRACAGELLLHRLDLESVCRCVLGRLGCEGALKLDLFGDRRDLGLGGVGLGSAHGSD